MSHVAHSTGINYFHQVQSQSAHPFLTYNVFTSDMLRDAVTLTFDPLILNVCSVSAVSCHVIKLCTVPKLGEVEQSAGRFIAI